MSMQLSSVDDLLSKLQIAEEYGYELSEQYSPLLAEASFTIRALRDEINKLRSDIGWMQEARAHQIELERVKNGGW